MHHITVGAFPARAVLRKEGAHCAGRLRGSLSLSLSLCLGLGFRLTGLAGSLAASLATTLAGSRKCLLVARLPTGGQCTLAELLVVGVRAAVSLRTVPVVTEVKADLLLCITALIPLPLVVAKVWCTLPLAAALAAALTSALSFASSFLVSASSPVVGSVLELAAV